MVCNHYTPIPLSGPLLIFPVQPGSLWEVACNRSIGCKQPPKKPIGSLPALLVTLH